jgi:hypothetical protein
MGNGTTARATQVHGGTRGRAMCNCRGNSKEHPERDWMSSPRPNSSSRSGSRERATCGATTGITPPTATARRRPAATASASPGARSACTRARPYARLVVAMMADGAADPMFEPATRVDDDLSSALGFGLSGGEVFWHWGDSGDFQCHGRRLSTGWPRARVPDELRARPAAVRGADGAHPRPELCAPDPCGH